MESQSVPFWDADHSRENHHWFVTKVTEHGGKHDFALVIPGGDGWHAKLIGHDGFREAQDFPSMQEAKHWVELTYALES